MATRSYLFGGYLLEVTGPEEVFQHVRVPSDSRFIFERDGLVTVDLLQHLVYEEGSAQCEYRITLDGRPIFHSRRQDGTRVRSGGSTLSSHGAHLTRF